MFGFLDTILVRSDLLFRISQQGAKLGWYVGEFRRADRFVPALVDPLGLVFLLGLDSLFAFLGLGLLLHW